MSNINHCINGILYFLAFICKVTHSCWPILECMLQSHPYIFHQNILFSSLSGGHKFTTIGFIVFKHTENEQLRETFPPKHIFIERAKHYSTRMFQVIYFVFALGHFTKALLLSSVKMRVTPLPRYYPAALGGS